MAVAVANLLLMGGIWVRLYRSTGGTMAPWRGIRAWVVTNLGRYIPGKIWQLGGLTAYVRDQGASAAAALVSVAAFQLVVLLTGVALAIGTMGVHVASGGWAQVGIGVLFVAILGTGLHPAAIRFAARRLSGLLGEASVGIRLRGRDIWGAAVAMLGAWIVQGIGLLFLLNGLGVPLEAPDPLMLSGIFSGSYVVGYVAVLAPGGIVVREGALTGFLVQFAGLSVGVGAAVAIAARVWAVVSELMAAVLVLAIAEAVERIQPQEDESHAGRE